jgi:thiamine-phosphate pyrophosphorylase
MKKSLRRHDPEQVQTVGDPVSPSQPRGGSRCVSRYRSPRVGHDGVVNRRKRLDSAYLYFIGDATAVGPTLEAALRGGADLFQLRDKTVGDDDLLRAAAEARALCHAAGALFVVNDRPDLAVAADADGVHVGQDDVSVDRARAVVGDERLVGLSTHTPRQIDATRSLSVDLIGVGPVHATPTKEGRSAVGTELVTYAAAHARVPWFAIGGLDERTLPAAVAAGARRASVVRAIAQAADPDRTARTLRAMLTEARLGTA